MLRRLLSASQIASLVLCTASVGLYVRGRFFGKVDIVGWENSYHYLRLETPRGRLLIEAGPVTSGSVTAVRPRGFYHDFGMGPSFMNYSALDTSAKLYVKVPGAAYTQQWSTLYDIRTRRTRVDVPPLLRVQTMGLQPGYWEPYRHAAMFSWWLLIGLTATPPAWRLLRRLRRRPNPARGFPVRRAEGEGHTNPSDALSTLSI